MTLGEALRIARTHGDHKMSLKRLAEASGVSRRAIGNWERDKSRHDAILLTRVLTALKMPFGLIMGVISDEYAKAYDEMATDISRGYPDSETYKALYKKTEALVKARTK